MARAAHSLVSLHHFASVGGGLVEVLQVGQHLTGGAPHAQLVDVGVSQHWILLLQTLTAYFHHLTKGQRRG